MSEQEWEDKLAEVQKHSEHWYNKYKELEKENRLLGERCNQLLKDKGDLTDKIADIKANCDLAIEGRDIKIKELEEENNKLLDVINNQDVKIADLESENAELRNNGFTVSAMTEQQLKVAIEKGKQLEKENAEQKDQLTKAKEILEELAKMEYAINPPADKVKSLMVKAEQFLQENGGEK